MVQISKKAYLFTHILPALKGQSAYFSLAAVKRALTEAEIALADGTAHFERLNGTIPAGGKPCRDFFFLSPVDYSNCFERIRDGKLNGRSSALMQVLGNTQGVEPCRTA